LFSNCADYFVINISSPNTPNLRELQQGENLSELLRRVIQARNSQSRRVPLFLKVAPDLNDVDIKAICKFVSQKDTKVDGLVVSNTTISRDTLKTESQSKFETGGLSGQPLEKVSTELVGRFYKELKGR
jgi:dihydroorotate dehydrogenase